MAGQWADGQPPGGRGAGRSREMRPAEPGGPGRGSRRPNAAGARGGLPESEAD